MAIEELLKRQTRELDRITLSEIRRLGPLLRSSRDRLRDRLDAWLKRETPAYLQRRGIEQTDRWTAQHSRSVLAQLEAALQSTGGDLAGLLQEGGTRADAAAVEHWTALTREAEKQFGEGLSARVDLRSVLRISEENGTLLERYAVDSTKWTARAVSQTKQILAQAVLEQSPISEIVDRLSGDDGPLMGRRWDALRLVRTEFAHRYNERAIEGMQAAAEDTPDMRKRLITPLDARTATDSLMIIAAAGNIVRPINEPFDDPYWGRTFMYPPNRPNDRSRVVMWRVAWGEAGGSDRKRAGELLASRGKAAEAA